MTTEDTHTKCFRDVASYGNSLISSLDGVLALRTDKYIRIFTPEVRARNYLATRSTEIVGKTCFRKHAWYHRRITNVSLLGALTDGGHLLAMTLKPVQDGAVQFSEPSSDMKPINFRTSGMSVQDLSYVYESWKTTSKIKADERHVSDRICCFAWDVLANNTSMFNSSAQIGIVDTSGVFMTMELACSKSSSSSSLSIKGSINAYKKLDINGGDIITCLAYTDILVVLGHNSGRLSALSKMTLDCVWVVQPFDAMIENILIRNCIFSDENTKDIIITYCMSDVSIWTSSGEIISSNFPMTLHSGDITGMWVSGPENYNSINADTKLHVITTGLDGQMICCWQIDTSEKPCELKFLESLDHKSLATKGRKMGLCVDNDRLVCFVSSIHEAKGSLSDTADVQKNTLLRENHSCIWLLPTSRFEEMRDPNHLADLLMKISISTASSPLPSPSCALVLAVLNILHDEVAWNKVFLHKFTIPTDIDDGSVPQGYQLLTDFTKLGESNGWDSMASFQPLLFPDRAKRILNVVLNAIYKAALTLLDLKTKNVGMVNRIASLEHIVTLAKRYHKPDESMRAEILLKFWQRAHALVAAFCSAFPNLKAFLQIGDGTLLDHLKDSITVHRSTIFMVNYGSLTKDKIEIDNLSHKILGWAKEILKYGVMHPDCDESSKWMKELSETCKIVSDFPPEKCPYCASEFVSEKRGPLRRVCDECCCLHERDPNSGDLILADSPDVVRCTICWTAAMDVRCCTLIPISGYCVFCDALQSSD
jgi:hypothetical protein